MLGHRQLTAFVRIVLAKVYHIDSSSMFPSDNPQHVRMRANSRLACSALMIALLTLPPLATLVFVWHSPQNVELSSTAVQEIAELTEAPAVAPGAIPTVTTTKPVTTLAPTTFEPAQFLPNWRDDLRCGPSFPAANGDPISVCDPLSSNFCCSRWGWCGQGPEYCIQAVHVPHNVSKPAQPEPALSLFQRIKFYFYPPDPPPDPWQVAFNNASRPRSPIFDQLHSNKSKARKSNCRSNKGCHTPAEQVKFWRLTAEVNDGYHTLTTQRHDPADLQKLLATIDKEKLRGALAQLQLDPRQNVTKTKKKKKRRRATKKLGNRKTVYLQGESNTLDNIWMPQLEDTQGSTTKSDSTHRNDQALESSASDAATAQDLQRLGPELSVRKLLAAVPNGVLSSATSEGDGRQLNVSTEGSVVVPQLTHPRVKGGSSKFNSAWIGLHSFEGFVAAKAHAAGSNHTEDDRATDMQLAHVLVQQEQGYLDWLKGHSQRERLESYPLPMSYSLLSRVVTGRHGVDLWSVAYDEATTQVDAQSYSTYDRCNPWRWKYFGILGAGSCRYLNATPACLPASAGGYNHRLEKVGAFRGDAGKVGKTGDTSVLVVYHHYENPAKCPEDEEVQVVRSNLLYFLRTAVRADDGADYVFNLGGRVDEYVLNAIPPYNNVRVRFVDDFTAHSDMCTFHRTMMEIGLPLFQQYKYFFIINNGMRGPFVRDGVGWQQHWTQPFTSRITHEVKLVGTYVSCEVDVHVQGPFLCTDRVGLQYMLDILGGCWSDHWEDIVGSEIGLSQRILSAGFNIASLQPEYHGFDFRPYRAGTSRRLNCRGNMNPTFCCGVQDPLRLHFVKYGGEVYRLGLIPAETIRIVEDFTSRSIALFPPLPLNSSWSAPHHINTITTTQNKPSVFNSLYTQQVKHWQTTSAVFAKMFSWKADGVNQMEGQQAPELVRYVELMYNGSMLQYRYELFPHSSGFEAASGVPPAAANNSDALHDAQWAAMEHRTARKLQRPRRPPLSLSSKT